jgi:hypothetical protein
MAEIGEPEKRRVLIPAEVPASPLPTITPNDPMWTEPAPEEPRRVPEKIPG